MTPRDARIQQLEAHRQRAAQSLASARADLAQIEAEIAGERHTREDVAEVLVAAAQEVYTRDWRAVLAELRVGIGALLGESGVRA